MKYFLPLVFLVLTACGSLPKAKVFFLESRQTSHLKLQENLDARLFHSASPLITEDKVITGNAQDGIRVYSLSGKQLWTKEVEAGLEGGFAYKDNRLYYGANDYNFYSVNIESGAEVWKFKTEGEVLSKPLLVNDRLYFTTANNILYCLQAKDGSLVWRYKRNVRDAFTVRGAASPVLHNGRIYVGFSDGYFTAINANDGSLAWERNLATSLKFKDVDASAVIDNDVVYVSAYDSALYAINAKEGRVLWSIESGGSYPVSIANGKVYFSTSDSKLLIIDKETGRILQTKHAKGIFQTAQVKENLLFVADTAGPLTVYNTHTDKVLAAFSPGHGISSPLVLSNKNSSVYFLSFGANLYRLEYGFRSPAEVY